MTVESDSSAARSRILALAALAIATVCFSVVPIAVRFSETGPIATAFWRFAFSILPLLVWAQISVRRGNQRQKDQRRVAPRSAHWTLFWVSVALAFDMILWHAAIANTSVVNSMLIAYSNPIFVALGAWFFLNERFGTQFLIGLVLAMLGSFLLIRHGSAAFGSFALGDYLAIMSAALFAVYAVGLRSLRRHFSTLKVITWNTVIPVPLLLIAAIAFGETILPQSMLGWGLLLGYAIVVHVVGQGLFTYAFAQLSAAFNAVAILGAPVLATVLGWNLLDESMTALQLLYGLVVLVGIYFAHRGSTLSRAA